MTHRADASGNGHSTDPKQPLAFVRPHGIDISREPLGSGAISARVVHLNAAGPIVKIELSGETGDLVHVSVTQERFRELQLQRNDSVYVKPRDVRVFEPEYMI